MPGLRREELALLAGLSPDYYSRLEQGRQPNVSTAVLDGLARALRLTEVEHAHLVDLAEPTARRRATKVVPVQRADPGLLRLMVAMDHLPVMLLGQRGEVLATNSLLTTVLHDLRPGASLVRFLFLDPVARERIVNWEVFAAATVATLRREAARRPQDGRLTELIDELRAADPDVSRWWDDHRVLEYTSAAKRIRHPVGGDLCFDIEVVASPQDPDQVLVVYTAEPDSPTARLLPMLASWGREVVGGEDPSHNLGS